MKQRNGYPVNGRMGSYQYRRQPDGYRGCTPNQTAVCPSRGLEGWCDTNACSRAEAYLYYVAPKFYIYNHRVEKLQSIPVPNKG